jgi:uncharacterized protein (TIGR01777 family)
MTTVLITGATGLIGTALSKMLVSKGYHVIILTRQSSIKLSNFSFEASSVSAAQWDIEKGTIDKDAIEKADYIVHLAGANIGEKRWTENRKKEIVDSRVKGGELIVKTLKEIPNNIKAVISASAIGWYGKDEDSDRDFFKGGSFKEDAPPANDFLGQTCEQWEHALQPVQTLGKRLIIFRQGIVLSNEGGVLTEFKKPLKFRISAILGSGKQIISWIHIEDLCRMYLYAIENNLKGVFNAVSSQPVSNKTFTLQLAKKLRGKFFIPMHVPAFVLKTVLGEVSVEVLKSAKVSSEKIKLEGFQFLYPSIDEAFKNLYMDSSNA